ncbi:acetyl/propionyl/methylcrotonyl-CoA carboxylase subunit alpha [Limnohabitans planktonicus]|uniref:3-methylcrotonyl-CoA carboxylase n=1 Tax=Limnohabitans planktonicus II-D5 TaxID=1293045 RepID=A0A2T7U9S1_9BURK|nr:biotin carboxylase N-terminal domain-containing protein [Limnohabitans planktonicus]PVE41352.1 3-methylcrotonyl-CoA carboxylase [Limnohabitans planktonicus II-D5]
MPVSKNIRPFHTVLVANRGEIALRVMRTVRRMGYGCVAIFSEADRHSLHVQAADRAVCIGPAAPAQSYLNIEAIIKAAQMSGADAVHPGYGFLSENDAFADAVDAAGLVFIGPSGENIRAMGNKAGAKRLMQGWGMPCIPGYEGQDQSDEAFVREAARIGFPIMCKAAAGGGGRGMRRVDTPDSLPAALASARSEARTAFGSDELILERALIDPRHVEIQLLADSHGHVVHLGERDCSVQRRHQKLIEEAPSPAVNAELRTRMGQVAVDSARAMGYVGAGTMEFLLDADGQFYFMEMNTRLQVEHAVTEAITGLDLVEWQLRVASGQALPWQQADIQLKGHAIEVRLTAEDVPAGFLPQTGPVLRWRPPVAHDVRIDSALVEGGEVSPHYDSMVAKIVAHGRDREEARRKLLSAVCHCVLLGLPSNQGFLADCLADTVFVQGARVDTGFVAERMGLPPAAPVPSAHTVALAALAAQVHSLPTNDHGHVHAGALGQGQAQGLLQCGGQRWRYRIRPTSCPQAPDTGTGQSTAWEVQCTALGGVGTASTSAAISDRHVLTLYTHTTTLTHVQWQDAAHTELSLECQGLREQICSARTDSGVQIFHAGRAWVFECPAAHGQTEQAAGSGAVLAPLTARVLQVMVSPGQSVQAGERLLMLEAMKMEHTLTAPITGVVRELRVQSGGQALKGALLLQIEAEAA